MNRDEHRKRVLKWMFVEMPRMLSNSPFLKGPAMTTPHLSAEERCSHCRGTGEWGSGLCWECLGGGVITPAIRAADACVKAGGTCRCVKADEPCEFHQMEAIVAAIKQAESAAVRRAIEDAVKCVEGLRRSYPEQIFPEPKRGRHGNTVDACSASAIRNALPAIAAAIRALAKEAP